MGSEAKPFQRRVYIKTPRIICGGNVEDESQLEDFIEAEEDPEETRAH